MLSDQDGTMHRKSLMACVLAFVGLSLVADKRAMFVGLSLRRDKPRTVTGTVTEWHDGESIAVGNAQNPKGFAMAVRRDTVFEGDIRTIKRGVRVTVWYRNVGERRLVVGKVRVLDALTGK
jgi:hypothetical protein